MNTTLGWKGGVCSPTASGPRNAAPLDKADGGGGRRGPCQVTAGRGGFVRFPFKENRTFGRFLHRASASPSLFMALPTRKQG